MDLHTRLTPTEVSEALEQAQNAGLVASSIEFVEWGTGPSRTHDRKITLQLGTYVKDSLLPDATDRRGSKMHVRKHKSSGPAGTVWAATYDETGWFIREVLLRDPEARFGSARKGYLGWEDFHRQTHDEFLLDGDSSIRPRALADAEAVLAVNREQLATPADGTWVNYLNP